MLCYLVLGWVVPKLLLSVESRLGPRPADLSHLRIAAQKVGFVIAALIGGIAVTLAIVFPAVGWVVYAVFLLLFLVVPFLLHASTQQRGGRRRAPADRRGQGGGPRLQGRRRSRSLPCPMAGVHAPGGGDPRRARPRRRHAVESGFDVRDFFSEDTDLIKGFDKSLEYYGPQGNFDYVFVEGDLTSPATLAAIEAAQVQIEAADAEFVRDFNGDIDFRPTAVTVVRIATDSGPMRDAIEASTGVEITDADGDGLADTPEQVGGDLRIRRHQRCRRRRGRGGLHPGPD